MLLPRGPDATIAIEKLTRYVLSPTHDDGKHKARVLRAELGLGLEHVDVLRTALLEAAVTGDAVEVITDQYGTRYAVDFVLRFQGRSTLLRSGWIIREPGGSPALATVFVVETNDNG